MTRNSSGRGSGDRGMFQRVKTARKRSNSSTLWLQRQLNDPYVRRAKVDGYRSRAAYKLIEINEKHEILKPGMRVVDLGCAPGGWSQLTAPIVGSTDDDPLVVGIDYLEVEPIPGVVILQKDFLDDDAPDELMKALGGHRPDLVMSDMAAPTTGHRQTDHLRTTYLFEIAIDFARQNLNEGGTFLSKVFAGGAEASLLQDLKKEFKSVVHIKPPASRKGSPEMFILARGYRGKK
ncbi:23S rRNA Um-2552 2'-O-methyltransferase [Pseudovibrio denitrificans]|uniref:Ribosomal RNA large subunit methyltransferase E n=1 Tax=Pseudovibrio denitrificans TaxID=258256 RepID=A0A1I6Y174_9HYPH|nr:MULTISPECIES: RlmE family RNA methyltransferase [Pseudovibrio]EEA92672.1 ribosomal RNA large subunit methyltransferase J [Pseudovibrio sp. JE062]SFT44300.1 23S rRNA Um-2552 2'-O-methyltransferase [Pseudovibrio denitrificans]